MFNKILNSSLNYLHNTFVGLLFFPLLATLSACTSAGDGSGANPGVEEFPIAYVKRKILLDNNGNIEQPDIREPLLSMPGGDLYLKANSSIAAAEINITSSITNGMGDVKDVNVSYDGKTLVFSLLPEDPNPNDNNDPKWDIYSFNRITNELKRVIASDILAQEGDDISPHFLPDGRIVFSSNRQSKSRAILLDENLSKPQFSSLDEDGRTKALVLHVMNPDGSNIEQISFNQSHDLDPSVLSDGRILFSRWDRMNSNNAINLYTVLADGSQLQPYYATHDESHLDSDGNTVQFIQPRELSDGTIMALSQPYSDTFGGGDIVIIDGINFVDLNQTTAANQGVFTTPALSKATITNVQNNNGLSLEGRYSSVYPLNDNSNRMLVSKGLCQVEIDTSADPANPILQTQLCIEPYLSDPTATPAYPAYGIWLYNRDDDTEKPVVIAEPGMFISNAVAMQPSTRPTLNLGTADAELDATLEGENVGLLHIRSVYDFGNSNFNGCFFSACTNASVSNVLALGDPMQATAEQRPARFIRIVKAVGLPNRNDPDLTDPPNLSNRAFGRSRRLGMKEIIGYSQIQPDGSVRVKVPADIAFYFEILDKNAHRIGPRHENWLQVNKGATLECTGCHTHTSTNNEPPLPHARSDAEAASINTGAPFDGYTYANTENPATSSPYFANANDTMAEVIARAQDAQSVYTGITPKVNVEYTDDWTDPAARAKDTGFSFVYSGASGLTTAIPTTSPCETSWDYTCRIVINYEEHIQPIWEVDRGANTCTSCHSGVDTLDAPMQPVAQLDLRSIVSDDEPQQITSYRELFFNDNFQEIIGGVLTDTLISVPVLDGNGDPVLDINGNPTFDVIPDPALQVSPSMSTNGARASRFMHKMYETNLNTGAPLSTPTVDHTNMLSPAELRLIAEWLDIGAQYFNNPFDPLAPQN